MVDCKHSCGGYGSAGEQPERRHEAEDRAERRMLCSLHSALSLAESEKLTGRSNLVFAIGEAFLDGFAIEMMSILTPGMVSSRGLRELEVMIEGLGIHDFCLARRFVVDGVN